METEFEYDERTKDEGVCFNIRMTHLKKFLPKDSDVLEVGCGNGYVSKILLKNNNHVDGFDYSPEAVKITEENIRKLKETKGINKETNFYSSDFYQFKPPKKYSFIVMSEVLEHLPGKDPVDDLLILKSWLKPEGRIIISVPIVKDKDPHHLRLFSDELLEELSKKAGLKIIRKKKWGSLFYAYVREKPQSAEKKRKIFPLIKFFAMPIVKIETSLDLAPKRGIIIEMKELKELKSKDEETN